MAALAGKGGKVVVAAATVAEIEEWTYSPQVELYEKTAFLATSKTRLAGVNDGSGSFKGRHDQSDTNGQVVLHNAMLAGTVVALKLYTDTIGAHFYSGNAFIKGKPMKASVLGLVEVQFDFQADGDWTYT